MFYFPILTLLNNHCSRVVNTRKHNRNIPHPNPSAPIPPSKSRPQTLEYSNLKNLKKRGREYCRENGWNYGSLILKIRNLKYSPLARLCPHKKKKMISPQKVTICNLHDSKLPSCKLHGSKHLLCKLHIKKSYPANCTIGKS